MPVSFFIAVEPAVQATNVGAYYMIDKLPINNNLIVFVDGLRDELNNPITGASIQANLYDASNTLISGPVTLTNLSGGNGNYSGQLSTSSCVVGQDYTLIVSSSGTGVEWRRVLRAGYRPFKV